MSTKKVHDWLEYKRRRMSYDGSNLSEFLRQEYSINPAGWHALAKTRWRSEEKRLMQEEAIENAKQSIKEVSKDEWAKFMKQTKQYYLANSKSILRMAKNHIDWTQKLPLWDLKILNNEMRIILWIPSTISSNSHRVEDKDEVDDFMNKLFAWDHIIDDI